MTRAAARRLQPAQARPTRPTNQRPPKGMTNRSTCIILRYHILGAGLFVVNQVNDAKPKIIVFHWSSDFCMNRLFFVQFVVYLCAAVTLCLADLSQCVIRNCDYDHLWLYAAVKSRQESCAYSMQNRVMQNFVFPQSIWGCSPRLYRQCWSCKDTAYYLCNYFWTNPTYTSTVNQRHGQTDRWTTQI